MCADVGTTTAGSQSTSVDACSGKCSRTCDAQAVGRCTCTYRLQSNNICCSYMLAKHIRRCVCLGGCAASRQFHNGTCMMPRSCLACATDHTYCSILPCLQSARRALALLMVHPAAAASACKASSLLAVTRARQRVSGVLMASQHWEQAPSMTLPVEVGHVRKHHAA